MTQTLRIYSHDSTSYHQEKVQFFVADIGDFDIILGTDWLEEHNSEIDWLARRVDMTRCLPSCKLYYPLVKNLDTCTEHRQTIPIPEPTTQCFIGPTAHQTAQVSKYVVPARRVHSVHVCTFWPFLPLGCLFTEDDDEHPDIDPAWEHEGLHLAGMLHQKLESEASEVTADSLPICAAFTNAQKLAERASGLGKDKSFEELVPAPYRSFQNVFDKSTSECLPEH
ncbi:hypothetical protein EVG20_g5238 [Dentipellis fragilis]|uniref:Reverse transcriptase domain-containing protein n=1 Tax=Dentipellis fragilis TaxID=205917 RepID=A0A4Y9YUI1_9AGAM|nr:hypothetical protein EVG20_g5238 [Dentipellis fragilis]